MAYETRRQYDDENEGAMPARSAPQAPVPFALGAGLPQPVPAAPPPAGVAGSKFVNFDRLLSANKDTADRMAADVGNRLDQGGQKALTGLSTMQGEFSNKVKAATPDWVPGANLTGVSIDRVAPGGGLNGGVHGVSSTGQGMQGAPMRSRSIDPVTNAPRTSVEIDEATKRAAATYAGPEELSDLEGWKEYMKAAGEARGSLAATGEKGGLKAIAQRDAGGGYTSGMASLDGALLQSQGGERFNQLREKYKNLDQMILDAGKASQTEGLAAQEAVTKAAGLYGGAVKDYNTESEGIQAGDEARVQEIADDDAWYDAVMEEQRNYAPGDMRGMYPEKEEAFDLLHGPGSFQRKKRIEERRALEKQRKS